MEIYKRVLSTMPQMFSTNEYKKRLRKLAESPRDVNSGRHVAFIKAECDRISNRMYVKRPKEQLTLEPVSKPVITEDMAVELLKSLGYKLLKPVKDWVEI